MLCHAPAVNPAGSTVLSITHVLSTLLSPRSLATLSLSHLSSPLLSSVISVNSPLDYEMVPEGLIYLTVMAKDGGNPALNSSVSVTVELFVSTSPPFMLSNSFIQNSCTRIGFNSNGSQSIQEVT